MDTFKAIFKANFSHDGDFTFWQFKKVKGLSKQGDWDYEFHRTIEAPKDDLNFHLFINKIADIGYTLENHLNTPKRAIRKEFSKMIDQLECQCKKAHKQGYKPHTTWEFSFDNGNSQGEIIVILE